jgi:hypothetical protein
MRRRKLLLCVAAVVLCGTAAVVLMKRRANPDFTSSAKLERTVVVPTLDTLIPEGSSAVWCGTLALAWQQFEKDIVKEPIVLVGSEDLARQLSETPSVGLLPEHFYAVAGFQRDGIEDRIRQDMKTKFPQAPRPPRATSKSAAVAYAYLEVGIAYEFMFNDIPQPMQFKNSQGVTERVKAFGIREEDKDHGIDTYRTQVRVLFRDGDHFAIDVSRNTRPYQIILAKMPKQSSLRGTLNDLEKRIGDRPSYPLGDEAILGIPNMDWRLEHHFSELKGKPLGNTHLPAGSHIQEASQFIKFKMDRRGVELRSGAFVGGAWNGSHPEDFRFNAPYLIVLKNRECTHPFFVMWVDNAELLQVVK